MNRIIVDVGTKLGREGIGSVIEVVGIERKKDPRLGDLVHCRRSGSTLVDDYWSEAITRSDGWRVIRNVASGNVTIKVVEASGRRGADELFRIYHSKNLNAQHCFMLVGSIDHNHCFLMVDVAYVDAPETVARLRDLVEAAWTEGA